MGVTASGPFPHMLTTALERCQSAPQFPEMGFCFSFRSSKLQRQPRRQALDRQCPAIASAGRMSGGARSELTISPASAHSRPIAS